MERALASDIRPGPLAAARRAAARHGIPYAEGAALELRLADGLRDLALDAGDAIAILGLGGREILGILEGGVWPRDAVLRIVVQPMQQAATLRLGLARLGFRRLLERVVISGGRDYQLWLLASPQDGVIVSEPDLFEAITGPWRGAGNARDPEQDPAALARYLGRLRHLWTARLEQERCTDESGLILDRAAIRALLAELEAIL